MGGSEAMRTERRLAVSLTIVTLAGSTLCAGYAHGRTVIEVQDLRSSPFKVLAIDGRPAPENVKLSREWDGWTCRSRLANTGGEPVPIKEVVLFALPHRLPAETRFYGEAFQMLSQTAGTLGKMEDLEEYTDRGHYKIPEPPGARAVYGMMTLSPPGGEHLLMGFTSCRRFSGKFYVRPDSIDVVVDAEGLKLAPGETWELEEFMFTTGSDRAGLLTALADRINRNHPPLRFKTEPTGWCSWYCFGPGVTARQVLDNLDFIAKNIPQLRYVQIDDGYQPAMGDWLETGRAFGGNIQGVLREIRQRGFEPAIWVGPFIAEAKSNVFKAHPDWFIKDAEGKPLRSDRVTFGGWRNGPWYGLDGTHPEAQKHLEHVFRTMRTEWGCTYFKLDANFWGAMHGGRFHDPRATRIEAYRRGMAAVLRGAADGFILGCNHPMWPSLGLIHGSRSSMDISRSWTSIRRITIQNFSRNWQNGRLWWNDPDCVLLTGALPKDEIGFHATAIYATGGMLLSGDNLTRMPADRLAMLRKLVPPTGTPAQFDDDSFEVGRIKLADRWMICLFNWTDRPKSLSVRLPEPCRISDYWSGQELGQREGALEVKDVPRHSARLLVARQAAR
jgi:alpha-galactosidase